MAKTKTYRAKRLGGLTKALTITLVFLAIGMIGYTSLYANLLVGVIGSAGSVDAWPAITSPAIDMISLAGSALYLIASLVAGFMALMFTYRSTANAHAFARGVSSGPTMALWWWIIPVASLFKPYSVMSEAWRVGRDPERWKSLKDPSVLRWWWGTYLVGAILATVGSFMENNVDTVESAIVTYSFIVGAMAIQLVSASLYVGIIRSVARSHDALIATGHTRPDPTLPGWSA